MFLPSGLSLLLAKFCNHVWSALTLVEDVLAAICPHEMGARKGARCRRGKAGWGEGVGGGNTKKNNHGKDQKLGDEATLFGGLRRENAISYPHQGRVLSRVDLHHYGMSQTEYNVTRVTWANDVRRRPGLLTKKILRNKRGSFRTRCKERRVDGGRWVQSSFISGRDPFSFDSGVGVCCARRRRRRLSECSR